MAPDRARSWSFGAASARPSSPSPLPPPRKPLRARPPSRPPSLPPGRPRRGGRALWPQPLVSASSRRAHAARVGPASAHSRAQIPKQREGVSRAPAERATQRASGGGRRPPRTRGSGLGRGDGCWAVACGRARARRAEDRASEAEAGGARRGAGGQPRAGGRAGGVRRHSASRRREKRVRAGRTGGARGCRNRGRAAPGGGSLRGW